jgi:hypothetical protein
LFLCNQHTPSTDKRVKTYSDIELTAPEMVVIVVLGVVRNPGQHVLVVYTACTAGWWLLSRSANVGHTWERKTYTDVVLALAAVADVAALAVAGMCPGVDSVGTVLCSRGCPQAVYCNYATLW